MKFGTWHFVFGGMCSAIVFIRCFSLGVVYLALHILNWRESYDIIRFDIVVYTDFSFLLELETNVLVLKKKEIFFLFSYSVQFSSSVSWQPWDAGAFESKLLKSWKTSQAYCSMKEIIKSLSNLKWKINLRQSKFRENLVG